MGEFRVAVCACAPSAETCDGVDNDCDSRLDESLSCACVGAECSCTEGERRACGEGLEETCVDGEYGPCAPVSSGSSLATVVASFPPNGFTTGSALVPSSATVADPPLRPELGWSPVVDATEYEVEVDDDCALATFRRCAFASPELSTRTTSTTFRPAESLAVSTVAPVGRRYFWRVRACNAEGCSAWSATRYFDVGRHSNDFNGDGYADLVLGAPFQDNPESDEGNAFVYYGSALGPGADPDRTLDNPADQANSAFGHSVASAGDINGDGYSDLVVGAPEQDSPANGEGNAFVYYGSATGLGATPDVTLDNPANQVNGAFGHSVASAGDVNGDGYIDLVVGAYFQGNPEPGEGRAFVYYGSGSGVRAVPDLTLDNPVETGGGNFGWSVASAGDVNGDGFADLVVGAPGQSAPEPLEGGAFVYHGSASGLGAMPERALDNPTDVPNGNFGWSVASAGDVNGDGYLDLVVGAFQQDDPEDGEGNVFVYYGSPLGIGEMPDLSFDNPADQAVAWFGYSVASAGDANGDGYADLVMGSPQQDNPTEDEGNAFVYYGSTMPTAGELDLTLDCPGDQVDALFGFAVGSAGDVNGDGYVDLVVGSVGQDNPAEDEGRVFVYYGSASGFQATPNVTLDNPVGQAGGEFGASVGNPG